MSKSFAIAIALAFGLVSPSRAGIGADNANAHFAAIAGGDLGAVMQGYNENAQLQWIGGPLDGSYQGTAAIRGVWEKFEAAQGPLKATVGALQESANPRGSTVVANVMFVGKTPIKVRYVLVYREGLVVSETWQIDPNLLVGAGAGAAPLREASSY
jgi:hypothetical protein